MLRVNRTFARVRLAQLDINQAELARRMDVTPAAVSNILLGANTTLDMLGKMAVGLECEPGDLLTIELPEPAQEIPAEVPAQ